MADPLEIPLFGLGLQGKSVNVNSTLLVNAYFEMSKEKDRTRVTVYGTPGLLLFLSAGDTPWRGLHYFPLGTKLYGVHRGTFYEISSSGTLVSRGSIGSIEGRVDICDDGTRITVVDGSDIYVYNTATPATPITVVADADRPTSPNTCIVQAGRVLTDENGTGQFKGSDSYAPTSWNALNFATAESNPDNLIRIINYLGSVVLLGQYSTEFWANVGGSGFPYARMMTVNLEYGLAARWSVAKFMGSYAFLSQNREGEIMVSMLSGVNPVRISNQEFEHIINGYASPSTATGFSYVLGGHPMYQLNFPAEMKSWLYDGSTKYWSEVRYGSNDRHRGEIAVDFNNTTIVSDYENGNLYVLDVNEYTDNGEPIHTILTGRHIFDRRMNVRINSIELGIEAGVGTSGQGEEPVAALRLSKDGGHTFGTERFAPLGKTGEYARRCIWRRCGKGRDIVPQVTITDPVKRVITECVLKIDGGLS